jgi:diaminopimelate epimerase
MQGLGNDFVVVEGPAVFTRDEVALVCDRRFGVGADGVLVVTRLQPSRMEHWNADGSAAEMCGNGLRCVARFVYERGWVDDRRFIVETPIGPKTVIVADDVVEVELGEVVVGAEHTIDGTVFRLVEVGNPHVVCFVDDPARVDVEGMGRGLQERFETGINVEFATVSGTGIRMRVWERGVGETLACGTGMAASVAAATKRGALDGPIEVEMPGGSATLEIRDGVAWMRGPVAYVFTGTVAGR